MIKLKDLISRPIIRDDYSDEYLNKMTDEEIKEWDKEITSRLEKDNVPKTFPEYNAAWIAKTIDYAIMYDLLKKEANKLDNTNKLNKLQKRKRS